MKTFYLLSVSLTLLHPCFANVAKEGVEVSQALQPTKDPIPKAQIAAVPSFPSFPIEEYNPRPASHPAAISQSPEQKPVEQPKSVPVQPALQKCDTPFHKMHIGLRHSEARGVGYRHGYTTLEGFGIWDGNTDFMPFIDLRTHVFDQGKFAGNAGVGGRTFFSSMNQVLGYYLYYDVRQENHGLTVQQLSPGIEVLGKRMEYRMNAYFPIIKNSHKYHFDFDRFDDHHIILKSKQKQAMTGVDAEVGAHLTQDTKYDVYAGAGPYYFTSSNASTWGGKVRLLGRFKEYVSLEATYTYDHLFGSIIQGSVGLSLPLGGKIKRKDKNCASGINLALSRAAFAPYRFEIPVVKRATRRSEAINPATDDPWIVWFVDNTSSSDGTFESPFPTLVQAQNASGPNDMIYVFPGDGTSKGMDAGITLQNGQTLFGSGISHKIKTQHGKIKIPAFSKSFPTITNTGTSNGDNVVTLANGNEVSGLNIHINDTSIAPGISGPNGINGAKITHNSFSSNIDFSGIDITGHGELIINNNQFVNLNPGAFGVAINVTADDLNATITVSNNSINGFSQGINKSSFGTANAVGETTIFANTITGFRGIGINYLAADSINSKGNIVGNTIFDTKSSGGSGISVLFINSPNFSGEVTIQGNTVISTSPSIFPVTGINVDTEHPTTAIANILNNLVVTGVTDNSIGIFLGTLANNSSICAQMDHNIVRPQVPLTNDIVITTGATTGTAINLTNNFDNVATNILITGNVNFVPEGTCNQEQ